MPRRDLPGAPRAALGKMSWAGPGKVIRVAAGTVWQGARASAQGRAKVRRRSYGRIFRQPISASPLRPQGNRLHKWHEVFAPIFRESTPDQGLAVLRMVVGVNATAAQTHFRIFLLAQGSEGELAQNGEIPRGVTFAGTAEILAEDNIECPVWEN